MKLGVRQRVGAMMLLLPASHGMAQDTIGLDFFLGYQLEATQAPLVSRPAVSVMDPFHAGSRTPSGLLYLEPRQQLDPTPLGQTDWTLQMVTELGVVVDASDTNAASYREYGDLSDDGFIGRVSVSLEHTPSAQFLELDAAAVGRSDSVFRVSGGRYGSYRIVGFYNDIPHWFADDASVLWNGVGSPRLSLPGELEAGASTVEQIRSAFDERGRTDLSLERTQYGMSATLTPDARWTLFGQVQSEERDGARPWGGAMSFPLLGQLMETVEPIDYRTTDVSLGMGYATVENQVNVQWTSSFFRNADRSLIWENAGLSLFQGDFVAPLGQLALPPDNDYHHVKLDYGRALSFWRSRISLSTSYSLREQNDRLLPPTLSSGVIDGFSTINLDQWNTQGALSQSRADLRSSHWSAFARWVARPTNKLRLKASVRVLEQDNDSDYLALNPLNGQYGYIALDGGLANIPNRSGIFDPSTPGSRVPIASIPFEKDTLSLRAGADYRWGRRATLGLSYVREEMEYAFRERDKIVDDKIKLQFQHRGNGTLRLAYEYTDRSGDHYEANPYDRFFSASLPDFQPRFSDGNSPNTLSSLRMYDLASRTEHTVSLKSIWLLSERMDFNVTGSWQERDYSARHGLRRTDHLQGGFDWSFYPVLNTSVYAFFHWQDGGRSVRNINDTGGNAGSRSADPDPGGDNYPLENEWDQSIDERHRIGGVGFSKAMGKFELQLNYTYTSGRTESRYQFASPGAFGNLPSEEVGNALPDIRFRHQLLEAYLRWSVSDRVSLSMTYRFEQEDLADFHYQDWEDPVVASGNGGDVYLLALPENYSANLFLTAIQWTF